MRACLSRLIIQFTWDISVTQHDRFFSYIKKISRQWLSYYKELRAIPNQWYSKEYNILLAPIYVTFNNGWILEDVFFHKEIHWWDFSIFCFFLNLCFGFMLPMHYIFHSGSSRDDRNGKIDKFEMPTANYNIQQNQGDSNTFNFIEIFLGHLCENIQKYELFPFAASAIFPVNHFCCKAVLRAYVIHRFTMKLIDKLKYISIRFMIWFNSCFQISDEHRKSTILKGTKYALALLTGN